MKIVNSEFITSAAKPSQYLSDGLPEVAFIGRSNVGKSSMINALTNRRNLARVSNTPGRTRLVNFFRINGDFLLVDLPGYGYAKVNKTTQGQLNQVLDDYFTSRDTVAKIVHLVDSRHEPSADDVLMHQFLNHYGIPSIVIGTKLDKLKRNEIKKNEKMIRQRLGMAPEEPFLMYSSSTKENHEEVLEAIFGDIHKEGEEE